MYGLTWTTWDLITWVSRGNSANVLSLQIPNPLEAVQVMGVTTTRLRYPKTHIRYGKSMVKYG